LLALLTILLAAQVSLAQERRSGGFPGPPWLESGPSNPLGPPGSSSGIDGGSDAGFLSGSMFPALMPQLSNLRGGYLFSFGPKARTRRLVLDYTVPVTVNGRDVLFGETHARCEDLFAVLRGSLAPEIQCLFGGGYRKRLPNVSMVGLNAFCNATRCSGAWYVAPVYGLEFVWITPGDGYAGINFNYYGNLFTKGGPGHFRLQGAYSQTLIKHSLDICLKAGAYRLFSYEFLYGWTGTVEANLFDGTLNLKYELGYDLANQQYHILGVNLNVGFHLDRLVRGESPFDTPSGGRR